MILLYFAEFNEVSDLMGKRIVLYGFIGVRLGSEEPELHDKGIVTDSITGEPLPYVAVILKGTTIGATTDLDGLLRSPLHSKYVLYRSSYLGYTEKELKFVPGKRNI